MKMLSNLSETLQLVKQNKKNKQVAKIWSINSKNKNLVQQCSLQKVWIILLSIWPTQKPSFSKWPILKKKIVKISWIGSWVGEIDWCEGHWCGTCGSTFASINPNNPMINPWNFHKKNLRVDDFEKLRFLRSPFWKFFLEFFF